MAPLLPMIVLVVSMSDRYLLLRDKFEIASLVTLGLSILMHRSFKSVILSLPCHYSLALLCMLSN